MDGRERWQALQAQLRSARAAFDAGDRDTALAAVTAALELDGEFLAAHALRDRILAMAARQSDPAPVDPVTSDVEPSLATPSHLVPSHLAASDPAPPDVPPKDVAPPNDQYANFEHRARRRRVDRKIDAARAAIAQHRLKAAAVALDEVIDLDPNLPELAALTASFDDLRRSVATPRRGPWVTAAAVFAAALLGGTWLEDATPILSRQIIAALPLPGLAPSVAIAERPTAMDAIGTSGAREADSMPAAAPVPVASSAAEAHLPAPQPAIRPLAVATVEPPPPTHLADALSPAPDTAAIVPASAIIPSRPVMRDDDVLIKQTLQRYRSAYEGLDAQSAHAVWPAVNEAALARAFDGLESQSLVFDECDVRLYGESATATCRGSARYVPKIGSREPRVEPRVWNFTLRKAGEDWKIDSARAER
jgi:hypothetical protein